MDRCGFVSSCSCSVHCELNEQVCVKSSRVESGLRFGLICLKSEEGVFVDEYSRPTLFVFGWKPFHVEAPGGGSGGIDMRREKERKREGVYIYRINRLLKKKKSADIHYMLIK